MTGHPPARSRTRSRTSWVRRGLVLVVAVAAAALLLWVVGPEKSGIIRLTILVAFVIGVAASAGWVRLVARRPRGDVGDREDVDRT